MEAGAASTVPTPAKAEAATTPTGPAALTPQHHPATPCDAVAALDRLRAWADGARADAAAAAASAAAAAAPAGPPACPLPSILQRPPPPGTPSPTDAAGLPPALDWAAVAAGRGGRAVRARLADVAAMAAVGRAAAAAARVAGGSPAAAAEAAVKAAAAAASAVPGGLPPPSLGPLAANLAAQAAPWTTPGGAVKGGGKPARGAAVKGKGGAPRPRTRTPSVPPAGGPAGTAWPLANAAAAVTAAAAAAAGGGAAGPSGGGGRTYTSRFRGVHQTFPTRRWEAQFRRAGKPTSLGCFDGEEEAARAYDKMQLWCELHGAGGSKGGITNFDPAEYEGDLAYLQTVSQDDLVAALRAEGRRQAAARTMLAKRAGAGRGGGRSGRGAGRG